MVHCFIEAVIPVFGGIYGYLVAIGKVEISKNPEKSKEWRQKWGKAFKLVTPILVLFGIINLVRCLYSL